MADHIKEFEEKTGKSRELYRKAVKLFPGGICHPVRYYSPYPFYVAGARGSKIWDVDGNEYVDFWMGHFALILGHSPKPVVEALQKQIVNGTQWGIDSELQVELAERIVSMVPCAEKIRFCATGTEATSYAVRLARGFTKKNVVFKAEGGWHGFCSDLLFAVKEDYDKPESLGLTPDVSKYTKSIPFNDIERTRTAIGSEKDVAAVIVEPVLGGGGMIPADREYLLALKELAAEKGFILIFDEVITGFRLGLGGAQEYYGVTPNLTTLGKIIGGGVGIGAVTGEEEIMDLADPTRGRSKGETVGIGGGTFSCNPLTMVAGIATLDALKNDRGIYERIGSLGDSVRKRMEKAFLDEGIPAKCTGVGSLFQMHFPHKHGSEVKSARDATYVTDAKRKDDFALRLISGGFYALHSHGCISSAHTSAEIDSLVKASVKIASKMAQPK